MTMYVNTRLENPRLKQHSPSLLNNCQISSFHSEKNKTSNVTGCIQVKNVISLNQPKYIKLYQQNSFNWNESGGINHSLR